MIVPDTSIKFRDLRLNHSSEQKPSDATFSTVFFRDNFRPEVAGDVMSGLAVDLVGVGVP